MHESMMPQKPSRPTASSGGSLYLAMYFSSMMNCSAAKSCTRHGTVMSLTLAVTQPTSVYNFASQQGHTVLVPKS